MKVLVVDVGGTHVKILVSGKRVSRKFPSGPTLTAKQMVSGVKKLAGDWQYDAVSIGYPWFSHPATSVRGTTQSWDRMGWF